MKIQLKDCYRMEINSKTFTVPILKDVADGLVGQVLAESLFLKVKTKLHFTESK